MELKWVLIAEIYIILIDHSIIIKYNQILLHIKYYF